MWFTKRRRAQNDQDYETWIMGGVSPTLNAFDNAHETRATVLIIDGRRTGDVRVTTEPVYTLQARMGTGGNNVPVIATDVEGNEVAATLRGFGHGWQGQHNSTHAIVTDSVLAFDGYNQSVTENVYQALRIGIDSGDHVAIPIDMRNALRDPDKKDEMNRQGLGVGEEGEPSHTITGAFVPGVATGDTTMQVRRLTPIECERLMGWPDNHTATGTTGPVSDTNRYKMCGNGVASPVAEWIGQHLIAIPMLNKARPDAE